MDIIVLNSQDLGSTKEVTTRFVYNNGVSVDKTWQIQSEIPSGSIIKSEGERMQNLCNRYFSYSSSLSSSLSLSTDFGNVTFTIISSSFDYLNGKTETFITASRVNETKRSGDCYRFVTLTQEEYTQDNFNKLCNKFFHSASIQPIVWPDGN